MGDWRETWGALITLIAFGLLGLVAVGVVSFALLYLFMRFQLRSPESATRFLNSHTHLNSFATALETAPAHCPHSGGVTILGGVATCASCGKPWLEIHQRPAGETIPIPREIRLRESPERLIIELRRWTWGTRFIGVFFLGFGSLILFATVPPLLAARSLNGDYGILAGCTMFYWSLWLLLGRTRLCAEDGRLSIRNGPIWWPGNHLLRTRALAQFYCGEVSDDDGGPPVYQLWVIDRGGGKQQLLSVSQRQVALYLEQLLEKHLGIVDRPVEGEASKLWVNIR